MNILFTSIAFPPKSDPEALQTAKYFYYLQKHKDLKIDVVTTRIPTLYMPYDKGLQKYASGINKLIEVTLNENRYINYIIHKLGVSKKLFPDFKYSFHKKHTQVLKALKAKPDLIYSRSFPLSSTIMAYKLSEALQVPWILHLSDPWADCPLEKRKGKNYRIHNKWENKCFEAAKIISLTSLPTIEFYRKKYPHFKDKFQFFPNVYEETDKATLASLSSNDKGKKFRIIYTGGLSEERSPAFLLEALKLLQQNDPTFSEKVEVIFAGDVDSVNRSVFEKYNLPFVKWLGKLPFAEALDLQKTADLLVVIDSPIINPALSMFFPSKLLDYMVARKRVLAITTPGSATHKVMEDLKGDVCMHNDNSSISSAIIRALEAYLNHDAQYLSNTEPPQKYEASYNANRLYELIKRTIHDQ